MLAAKALAGGLEKPCFGFYFEWNPQPCPAETPACSIVAEYLHQLPLT